MSTVHWLWIVISVFEAGLCISMGIWILVLERRNWRQHIMLEHQRVCLSDHEDKK